MGKIYLHRLAVMFACEERREVDLFSTQVFTQVLKKKKKYTGIDFRYPNLESKYAYSCEKTQNEIFTNNQI